MKKTKIHIGKIFRFHGKQYTSVGYFYKLKYNEKAFDANYYYHELYKPRMEDYHLNPKTGKKEYRAPCGSDEKEICYVLTARRFGIFKVEETQLFQKQTELHACNYILALPFSFIK